MDLQDVPLMAMLRERMTWLNQRQDLLSQNVANADTPRYVARDLKPLDFDQMLGGPASPGAAMMTTNARHISMSQSRSGKFEDHETPDQEFNPNGNAVSLEVEMIKVSETQAQYQAAANLYGKAMTMMKTAIGR
jgi:flagellar basal-body rod protein FlgB